MVYKTEEVSKIGKYQDELSNLKIRIKYLENKLMEHKQSICKHEFAGYFNISGFFGRLCKNCGKSG